MVTKSSFDFMNKTDFYVRHDIVLTIIFIDLKHPLPGTSIIRMDFVIFPYPKA